MRERGQEFVFHPANPFGLGSRRPLQIEISLTFLLQPLTVGDVNSDTVEPHWISCRVSIEPSLRPHTSAAAIGGNDSIFNVVRIPTPKPASDCFANALAILRIDQGIEEIEIDLRVERKKEMLFGLRVPFDAIQRQGT